MSATPNGNVREAAAFLAEAAAAGIALAPTPRGTIRWKAPAPPAASFLDRLKALKPDLLALLTAAERQDWRDRAAERAAIREFEAGLPRAAAEREAALETLRALIRERRDPVIIDLADAVTAVLPSLDG